jgi:hypothetical protein
LPRITLSQDDLIYATGILYAKKNDPKWFAYDSYSANSPNFNAQLFRNSVIKSIAIESYVRRLFSIPRRPIEDFQPDMPNGVEISFNSSQHSRQMPYMVERRDGYHPTLTGFAIAESDRDIDLKYLIVPEMMARVRIFKSYPKPSGITRHLINEKDAQAVGACDNITERLHSLMNIFQGDLKDGS